MKVSFIESAGTIFRDPGFNFLFKFVMFTKLGFDA